MRFPNIKILPSVIVATLFCVASPQAFALEKGGENFSGNYFVTLLKLSRLDQDHVYGVTADCGSYRAIAYNLLRSERNPPEVELKVALPKFGNEGTFYELKATPKTEFSDIEFSYVCVSSTTENDIELPTALEASAGHKLETLDRTGKRKAEIHISAWKKIKLPASKSVKDSWSCPDKQKIPLGYDIRYSSTAKAIVSHNHIVDKKINLKPGWLPTYLIRSEGVPGEAFIRYVCASR